MSNEEKSKTTEAKSKTTETKSSIPMKRLLRDVKTIMRNPLTSNGIHYFHSEIDMYKGYALIIGPDDTPYQGGYYFFEFMFPTDYPYSPPKVLFQTNDGTTRFNPNLYRNGKVCLSILNTWRGEQWTSCQTITSILLTLVTVFNNNPLTNEPGYTSKSKYCEPYRNYIEYMNYKTAIRDIINKKYLHPDFIGFYPLIIKNFKENGDKILNKLDELKKSNFNNLSIHINVYDKMKTYINYTKIKEDIEALLKQHN